MVTARRAASPSRTRAALAVFAMLAVLAAGTACTYVTDSYKENLFSGDSFPTHVETTSGAIVVGLAESGRPARRTAVLDVMSPLTAIDRGPDTQVSVDQRSLTLFGARSPGEPLDHPRARFTSHQVVTLHPCDRGTEVCEIGTPDAPRPFDAILGIDAFASDALRLRMAASEIVILPNIGGSDRDRSRACDAVLPNPFRGGGTLILGGTELKFSNRRIAIDSCIAPNPDRTVPQRQRGVDALFVLSTAASTSLLNTSAYERYRALDPSAPAVETLPEHVVLLPSGPVAGRLTELPSIALVGNMSANPRAPCRQVWAHHLLAYADCRPAELDAQCADALDNNGNGVINDGCPAIDAPETGPECLDDLDNDGDGAINDGCPADDCPCTNGDSFCPAPAIVELAPPAGLPVLIVPDDERTLQALRTELRPDRPEVDGILGTSALETLELDIDYSNGRVLARCLDRQACGARVTLSDRASRTYIAGCLGDSPGPIP